MATRRRQIETPKDTIHEFTTRSVMSLVMEAAELKEAAGRFGAVVAALAVTYGVSTEV